MGCHHGVLHEFQPPSYTVIRSTNTTGTSAIIQTTPDRHYAINSAQVFDLERSLAVRTFPALNHLAVSPTTNIYYGSAVNGGGDYFRAEIRE